MSKKLDSAQIAKLVEDAIKAVSINAKDGQKLLGYLADTLPPLDGTEEEKPPAQKKQYVVLVSDPARTLPDDFSPCCWVLQIPDDEAPQAVESFIVAAAEAFNATKRGRALPVQTIGEACESIPAKLAKEYKLWVKTKSPTYALVTRNELPNTDSLLDDDNRGGPKEVATEAPIWVRAIQIAKAGQVSTSKLQRELKISYTESLDIMHRLEDEGIIDSDAAAQTGGAA